MKSNAGTHRLIHSELGKSYYVRLQSYKAPGLYAAWCRLISRLFRQ